MARSCFWAALVVLAGCGSGSTDSARGSADAGASAPDTLATGHPALRGVTDPRERAARIRAAQTNPGPGYAVRMSGDAARFAAVTLALDSAPAITARRVHENRVELRRGAALAEWYASGPLGLEQGFVVGRGPVTLRVAVGGARAEQAGRAEVKLVGAHGDVIARYGEAYAEDARGHALPVHLQAQGDAIAIDVDARGATYPVTIDPLLWTEMQVLTPWDGDTTDYFGAAVALDGTTALVGAPSAKIATVVNQGAVYAWSRGASGWQQQQKLLASDGAFNARLGGAVALSGDTAIVGADHDGGGSAYVFVKSGSSWTEQQKLTDAAAGSFDRYGHAVAIEGDTALVGSSYADSHGAGYVYTRSGTTWTLQQKLQDTTDASLGFAAALSGDTVLLGDPNTSSNTGAMVVFVRNGTTWTEQQKLVPADAAAGDYFGSAVALEGDTAIGTSNASGSHRGAAYVFTRSGTTWTEQQKLVPADAAAGDYFGRNVALVGNTALISAPYHFVGAVGQGAAYTFTRSGGTFTEDQTLAAAPGATQFFGYSAALAGHTALIGAATVAKVHVFDLVGASCTTGECSYCVDGTCCSSACTTPCRSCVTGSCTTPVTDQDDDNCTGTRTCDSVGNCRLKPGQACTAAADCASDFCADGVCCDTACNGACDVCNATPGTCTPAAAGSAGEPSCAPYLCDGTSPSCAVDCSTDSDCAAGAYCAADSTCRAVKAQGAACNDAAGYDCLVTGCRECATPGGCVDGYCCDSACDGACDACDATPGTCTLQPKGAAGTPPCAPYLCGGTTPLCATSCAANGDCTTDAYCDAGACVGTKQSGDACTNDAECQSAHCTDGVCCDAACDGQCEACDVQGAIGTCTPVVGTPHGARAACPAGSTSDPCAAARCDGVERESCADFADSTVPCAEPGCADGLAKLAAYCDGAGECSAPEVVDCGAYACDAATCKTTCSADSDCYGKNRCDLASSKCVAPSKCTDDATSVDPAGNVTHCSPYMCAGGTCKTACTSTRDCIDNTLCDTALGTCVAAPDGTPARSADSAGCSCRIAGMPVRRGIPRSAAWLLAAVAALSRRRRRRT